MAGKEKKSFAVRQSELMVPPLFKNVARPRAFTGQPAAALDILEPLLPIGLFHANVPPFKKTDIPAKGNGFTAGAFLCQQLPQEDGQAPAVQDCVVKNQSHVPGLPTVAANVSPVKQDQPAQGAGKGIQPVTPGRLEIVRDGLGLGLR